jgi:DNA-binding LytR/AlgR family response regulator
MITAIAIDDEPSAIDIIQHHVARLKHVELIAHFHHAKKALDYLKKNPVDLIFLDINMPEISGLELLESLQVKPEVIFTTAYSEFAVESYAHNAVDYLLKPFEFDRFQLAVNKVQEKISSRKHEDSFFFIKDGFKNIKVSFENMLFVKSSGNYLDIHTNSKVHTPRMTFGELIQKLPLSQFLRVHQSYLIYINAVEKIENNHIYIDQHKIPISSSYKEEVFRRFGL